MRKSDRYWAGLSTDLVIEQDMMAAVKGKGGLTRGRGLDESTRSIWLGNVTECATISAALTELVGGRKTVDHVEFTRARMKRDAEDLEKLMGFFKINNPFRFSDTARLVSLSSGTVANDGDGVNCDIAGDVGMQISQTWQDMNYSEIILRKNQTVKTLASVHNVMKLGDKFGEIDANRLFQRLVLMAHTNRSLDIQSVFNYELPVFPAALFKNGLMRKPDKPSLFRESCAGFTSATPNQCVALQYVVDGGCLLRKVRWVKGSPFAVVVTNYSTFIAKHFGSSVSIVFDGYSSIPTTKDHEHSRRVSKVSRIAPEVQVDINGIVVYEQEAFFADATNKQQFVNMLARHLETCGFSIK